MSDLLCFKKITCSSSEQSFISWVASHIETVNHHIANPQYSSYLLPISSYLLSFIFHLHHLTVLFRIAYLYHLLLCVHRIDIHYHLHPISFYCQLVAHLAIFLHLLLLSVLARAHVYYLYFTVLVIYLCLSTIVLLCYCVLVTCPVSLCSIFSAFAISVN